MALNVWTQSSGYSFGTFYEQVRVLIPSNTGSPATWSSSTAYAKDSIVRYNSQTFVCVIGNTGQIPVNNNIYWAPYIRLPVTDETGVTFKVISGELPHGLKIQGKYLVGTPSEVSRLTTYNFCIRASKGKQLSDRTFKIVVDGADVPEFANNSGSLDIGVNHQYFLLDSTYVDYQIQVFDSDTAAGQRLSYFIKDGGGILPPGLILTDDGRIVGFVQPSLIIKPEDGTGDFDTGFYDAVAYDFGLRSSNGYDSFTYESVSFDYNTPISRPRSISRNYEFVITVTDGDTYVDRTFTIYVVGDDLLRADNTIILATETMFTVDSTYLRKPIWVTNSFLGVYRSDNYLTLVLELYDNEGVSFDFVTTSTPWVPQYPYAVNDLILINNSIFICLTAHTSGEQLDPLLWAPYGLPPGVSFDSTTGQVYGQVPYRPSASETYYFTINATRYGEKLDSIESAKTFKIVLLGAVDSVITWNTPGDLGSINANYISTLKVEAESTVNGAVVLYRITSGRLPNGLSLDPTGEIVGKVIQFGDDQQLGLTTFSEYSGANKGQGTITTFNQTFDNESTTFDKVYTFTVEAKDQFNYSAITKTFTIKVDTPSQISFSNIRTKPLLKTTQRTQWKNFINDSTVFTPSSIYRPNDPNFGVQLDLSVLVYAGIETKEAGVFVSAMGLNNKKKRFQFGSVSKAVAIDPITKDSVYEVVYINMLDPLEPNGKRLPAKMRLTSKQSETIKTDLSNSIWSRSLADLTADTPNAVRPENYITVDGTKYQVSDPNARTYYTSSISVWRDNIKYWLANKNDTTSGLISERNYLPLWMRSIQPGTKSELGFTLAVPICYCKVGTADDILLNIKNYIQTTGFDFKLLDFTADRYIIDSVTNYSNDKYLVFKNDRITI